MMRVSGEDGRTPVLSVDDEGYWLIDGRRIETSGGGFLKAEGKDGDSLFAGVKEEDGNIVFTLAGGETFSVPKAVAWSFEVDTEGEEIVRVEAGRTRTLAIKAVGVDDYAIMSTSDGWKASATDGKLSITAPKKDGDRGEIVFLVVTDGGMSKLVKTPVRTPGLVSCTIDFEGPQWDRFVAANYYPGATYSNMILNYPSEYGYPLWVDKTTQLSTAFPQGPGVGMGYDYPWMLSSYNSNDSSYGDYLHDLYVYNPDNADATTGGGNNGSDNFLVSFGYSELAHPEYGDNRPVFLFADGKARTIRSMFVNSTCYFFFVAGNGNALSPALGEGEAVTWYATGFDEAGNELGTEELTFATPDNFIVSWTEWDLSGLGPVVSLRLNQGGGTDNGYGYSLPAYYAVDDITVEWRD